VTYNCNVRIRLEESRDFGKLFFKVVDPNVFNVGLDIVFLVKDGELRLVNLT